MAAQQRHTQPNTARHQAGLVALAIVITAAGHLAVDWANAQQLLPATTTRLLVFLFAAIALHTAVRRVLPHATAVLLPAVLLLAGVGMTMIHRIDGTASGQLATAQLVWFAVGGVALVSAMLVSRRLSAFAAYPYLFLVATLTLLLLPLIPGLSAGVINGARLWIDVFGMRFQPGEAAKLSLILFLAAYLSRHHARLQAPELPLRQYAPVVLAAMLSVGVLVGLRDVGQATLLLAITLLMLFVATAKPLVLLAGAGMFAAGTFVAHQQFVHVAARFAVWQDPFADVFGAGYQLSQSLFAFATGGLTGTGLGFGRPEDLPFAATDAVFAVIGEELGLLGTTAVLSVLIVIIMRGFRIATHAPDHFTSLVAFGITVMLAVQTLVIVAGVIRLMPLTGLTLPFVSYGGSSLVVNMFALGVLLGVDHDTKQRAFRDVSVRR